MNKEKRPLLIVGIILLIVLIIGITYAWLTWSSSTKITGVSKCFDIAYVNGANINANLVQIDTPINGANITYKFGMASSTFKLTLSASCNTTGTFEIVLHNNAVPTSYISGSSAGALKYVLVANENLVLENSYGIVTTGNINTTSDIIIYTAALEKGVTKTYTLIVYVDGNFTGNDAKDSAYSGYVSANATQTLS